MNKEFELYPDLLNNDFLENLLDWWDNRKGYTTNMNPFNSFHDERLFAYACSDIEKFIKTKNSQYFGSAISIYPNLIENHSIRNQLKELILFAKNIYTDKNKEYRQPLDDFTEGITKNFRIGKRRPEGLPDIAKFSRTHFYRIPSSKEDYQIVFKVVYKQIKDLISKEKSNLGRGKLFPAEIGSALLKHFKPKTSKVKEVRYKGQTDTFDNFIYKISEKKEPRKIAIEYIRTILSNYHNLDIGYLKFERIISNKK